MDIGRCFKDAWNLLMKDLAPLAVTAVIAAVVIGVAALLLGVASLASLPTSMNGETIEVDDVNAGALFFGWLVVVIVGVVVGAWEYSTLLKIMVRRVREGRAATMDDLRLGFEGIGAFIAAMIVLGIALAIGFVLLIIPGLILMTIWAYVLVLIADKKSRLGEAMSESSALAKKPGYFMTFVTLLLGAIVVGVVSGILGIIPVIGQILGLFVGVYGMAYVVAMYFQATGETALVDHALYDAPPPSAAGFGTGYPPAPPVVPPGTAYPPAPSAPMGGGSAVPAPPVIPPPPPPAPVAPEVVQAPPAPPPAENTSVAGPDPWATAADPLATAAPPAPPAFEPPATSVPPSVDEESGTLEQHCSQCGAAINASDEFCRVCGVELSGGHAHDVREAPDVVAEQPPAGEDAADGPAEGESDAPAVT